MLSTSSSFASSMFKSCLSAQRRQFSSVALSQLNNGVKVVSSEPKSDASSSTFGVVGVVTGAGARNETRDTRGASLYTEHILYHMNLPTMGYSSYVKALEALGAENFRIVRDRENISYLVEATEKNASQALQILYALAASPVIEEYHLEQTRDTIERITSNLSSLQVLEEELHKEAFRGQALGNPAFPTAQLTSRLTPEAVNSFRLSGLSQSCALIGHGISSHILSDVASKQLSNPFETASGELQLPSQVSNQQSRASRFVGGGDVRILNSSSEVHVALGFEGAKLSDVDATVALAVLGNVLGTYNSSGSSYSGRQGALSKLSHPNLREAYSFNRSYKDTGLFGVVARASSESSPEKLPQLLLDQLKQLADSKLDKARVDGLAKLALVQLAVESESNRGRVQSLLRQMASDGQQAITFEQFQSSARSLTPEKLQQAAQKLVDSKPVVVGVGDVHELGRL